MYPDDAQRSCVSSVIPPMIINSNKNDEPNYEYLRDEIISSSLSPNMIYGVRTR
jgi:hypothetical protein